jgi:purine-nucleoside phosphorylase
MSAARAAGEVVRSRTTLTPRVGVVLGSGLGTFAAGITDEVRFAYAELPGFPVATAIGHKGELILGRINGTPVVAMSGRFHLYEGYTARDVTAGIRLFRELGVTSVVLTNAAGGIHTAYRGGALVMITDHINLQGTNPLLGPNEDADGPRFPDMTEAYSERLRGIARAVANELGIDLQEGVYAGLLGPSYETPAEIRFLRTIGADLVGMSTIAETIAARHMGMEVLGISCVTNIAAGLSGEKLDHQEVLETARRVADTFGRLLSAILTRI